MVSEKITPLRNVKLSSVLILVLVEDGLGAKVHGAALIHGNGLNPCFSGGWSRRINFTFYATNKYGLNPCFSGGWSRSVEKHDELKQIERVLILVLVEDGLGEQLLEVSVSETVVMKFLISLTFGDQKYVPFRVLSQMQIYEFSVSANMFSENISEFFCGDAGSKK